MGAVSADIATVFDTFHDCLWRSGWSEDLALAAERADRLCIAYTGADRHYHDITHIAAMLRLLDTHAPSHPDWVAIRWAILYHDVVYDPRRKDNEAESAAAMARDFAALGLDPALAARVEDLILATRHGEVAASEDATTALLIDLDLAVLAAPSAAYDAYAAAIRREYSHVPDALYREGRARVLQGFLDQPAVYRTDALKSQWEASARANLTREIGILRNG